jgi:ParB-like chromosome segregation protein Spo0J
MNDLEVCSWPIAKPIPYARNSHKIPERAIDKVAASIKEFGWRSAIVVDADGVIICGHTRLLAAKKLGLEQVPVHVASNLTPAQVKDLPADGQSLARGDGLGPGTPRTGD